MRERKLRNGYVSGSGARSLTVAALLGWQDGEPVLAQSSRFTLIFL